MPSIFNSMRFWAFYESSDYTTIFLPYFEPSVVLDGDELAFESSSEHYQPSRLPVPTMNPALIFKALGDNTRYAIISHIAQSPRTAAELSKILKVSKPTISHHVSLLRKAGLLSEKPEARSVQLSLKREIIESLSEATGAGTVFQRGHQSIILRTNRFCKVLCSKSVKLASFGTHIWVVPIEPFPFYP